MKIYGKRKNIGSIIRHLCEEKRIEIIEVELHLDHIQMLISIQFQYNLARIMLYLKGRAV